jgi:cation transport regulator ChaC
MQKKVASREVALLALGLDRVQDRKRNILENRAVVALVEAKVALKVEKKGTHHPKAAVVVVVAIEEAPVEAETKAVAQAAIVDANLVRGPRQEDDAIADSN